MQQSIRQSDANCSITHIFNEPHLKLTTSYLSLYSVNYLYTCKCSSQATHLYTCKCPYQPAMLIYKSPTNHLYTANVPSQNHLYNKCPCLLFPPPTICNKSIPTTFILINVRSPPSQRPPQPLSYKLT